ncbi:MAG: RNA methyltransferase [Gemmatimonadetes bacterium]|nr:RNA methyltransferase [Gemmatimonadota bacterium]MBT7863392.1 RNA methyltransferase [Gemmatimonadota bacterium]
MPKNRKVSIGIFDRFVANLFHCPNFGGMKDEQLTPPESLDPPLARPLDGIRIVLVEPGHPGNIGSVARVLKNTGIAQLVLVNPVPWREEDETRWMAHGSHDILDGAREVDTLEEALADTHFVIGTTHRLGRFRVVEEGFESACVEAVGIACRYPVAVVFGREKDGLSREELLRCHRLVRIPSAVDHPSFNLSQAVLLLAYELFRAQGQGLRPDPPPLATVDEFDRVVGHILSSLERIGFKPFNDDMSGFERVLRRYLSRVPLERRDASVLHRICNQIGKFSRHFKH